MTAPSPKSRALASRSPFAAVRAARVAVVCAGFAGLSLGGCSAESAPGTPKAAEKGCSKSGGAPADGEKSCGQNSCGKK